MNAWLHDFLKREMFHTKLLDKIKTHILCPITFFPQKNLVPLRYVEKYGTASQPTDANIIRRMRFAYWLRLQIHTQTICNT
jgi:hypothetical protein